LKVKVGEFDLYDLSKVTDERVQDTADVAWIRLRVIDGHEGSLRLTEAFIDQALTRYNNQSSNTTRNYVGSVPTCFAAVRLTFKLNIDYSCPGERSGQ